MNSCGILIHLGVIVLLRALQAFEQEKGILETQECQAGDLWQTGEQRVVFMDLEGGKRKVPIRNRRKYF